MDERDYLVSSFWVRCIGYIGMMKRFDYCEFLCGFGMYRYIGYERD